MFSPSLSLSLLYTTATCALASYTYTYSHLHLHSHTHNTPTTHPQHTRADTFLCLNVFLFALLFKGCFWGCTIQRADDTTPGRTATTLLAATYRASPMLLCPVLPVLCLLLRKRHDDAWWFREQACAFCTFLWVYVRVSIYLSVCNVLYIRICFLLTYAHICLFVFSLCCGFWCCVLWQHIYVCVCVCVRACVRACMYAYVCVMYACIYVILYVYSCT